MATSPGLLKAWVSAAQYLQVYSPPTLPRAKDQGLQCLGQGKQIDLHKIHTLRAFAFLNDPWTTIVYAVNCSAWEIGMSDVMKCFVAHHLNSLRLRFDLTDAAVVRPKTFTL